ncbi:MAG: glycosyl transferase, partial [Armatimonadota bacterium]|nr:glycosyl transferase [Armatimonadota bacterium]
MGWERKRGKLEELNRLLNGESVTRPDELHIVAGQPESLTGVRFVITLDADTQLPHGAARRLIETLAHPLQRPRIEAGPEPGRSLVSAGYTIIQPRVSTSLPSATATRFARLFTDARGTDPYTHVSADVYQDLFGEGSYHGKGIYDVAAFHRVLSGRFPPATLLSHDLIEGAYVRVGLASDVELFDEFPPNYLAYCKRQHRWIRGDWQIFDWITGRVPSPQGGSERNPLSGLNRWKIADNLRRSLVPPASVAFLSLGWLVSPATACAASLFVGAGILLPTFLQIITWLTTQPGAVWQEMRELRPGVLRAALSTAFLAHQAGLALDAIGRVWYRRLISRRLLLEWESARLSYASSEEGERRSLWRLGGSSVFAAVLSELMNVFNPRGLLPAAPFLFLWSLAPILARWLSAGHPARATYALPPEDRLLLRRVSRQTWRYFDDFVGPQTNWLAPDNYQETLNVEIAQRTSPTNIGMWLTAVLVARDFGYISCDEAIVRLRQTLQTLNEVERFHGHLLNWYNVQTLEPLPPRYVSVVDSGNLLACLIVLAQAGRELMTAPLIDERSLCGLADVLGLLEEALAEDRQTQQLAGSIGTLAALFNAPPHEPLTIIQSLRAAVGPAQQVGEALCVRPLPRKPGLRQQANLEAATTDPRFAISAPSYWAAQVEQQIDIWLHVIDRYLTWMEILGEWSEADLLPLGEEAVRWRQETLASAPSLAALGRGDVPPLWALLERRRQIPDLPPPLAQKLDHLEAEFSRCRWLAGEMLAQAEALLDRARRLADEMDMRFLYDPERKLFPIGFNVEEMRHDTSYYDLLASECRLASFIAIARGDVPVEHWLTLGRRFSDVNGQMVLLSWSGTMFEYLMPLLFTPTFENSLLDHACKTAVAVQIDYGRQRGVPWGISESAFSALDTHRIYQYKAFGVPGLGIKRGLEEDLVIAPYATVMALQVAPQRAIENLKRLAELGMRGDYGFYESIDFARQHLGDEEGNNSRPSGERGAVVRTYMVHHQGMSLLALDNMLHDNMIRTRFMAEPRMQATTPLLYEGIPVAPPVLEQAIGEARPQQLMPLTDPGAPERIDSPDTPSPRTLLLSNGSYSIMVTAAGGGYSRWRDLDITRWRADTTRDHWGSFFYLRDLESSATWSNTHQPLKRAPRAASTVFSAEKAHFRRYDADIETITDIVVSPEDDAEMRRVILINHSDRTRQLEITSYAELVLAPHNADRAHPAFSKLFVRTEALPEQGILLASRRPRSPEDPPVWAGHLVTGGDSEAKGPVRLREPVLSEAKDGEGEPAEVIGASDGLEPTTSPSFDKLRTGSHHPTTFETDRARFLGRGRTTENPVALEGNLSNTSGAVLDPIFSLRRRISLRPGQRLELAFITAAAETREGVLGILEKYAEPATMERTLDMAWTHAQLEMHHLRIQPEDVQRFQQLAGYMLYPFAALRAPARRLRQNTGGQQNLWGYGISGDLPIMVVTVGDERDLEFVRQALMAHTFWRVRGFKADLVILNEKAGGYNQELSDSLKKLIQGYTQYTGVDQPGGVFVRPTDTMPEDDVTLLLETGRVVLVAARGSLAQQLSAAVTAPERPPRLVLTHRVGEEPSAMLPYLELPYFNGVGGFTPDGREYAIYLGPQTQTPAPWVNVVATPESGMVISASGQGFTWFGNSQSNRLTPWNNDPISDPATDTIYIRDEDMGTFWSPTALPIRELDAYRARHGQGYTVFEHNSHAIEQELVVFVPMSVGGWEDGSMGGDEAKGPTPTLPSSHTP